MTDLASGADERCVTCQEPIATRYCAACGERRASDRRYSLKEFFHEALEALLSFDGRAVRTFKTLLTKPGELTAAYMRGSRLPYLTPLNCFLVANLVYFIWAAFSGSNTFSTTYRIHLTGTPYAAAAKRAVVAHLARTGEDETIYATRFNAIGQAQSKSLVIAMVPAFALIVGLVTLGGGRKYAVQHLAFSLHFYAYVFWMSIITAYVIGYPTEIVARYIVGRTPNPQEFDDIYSILLVGVYGAYLTLALRRAYGFRLRRAIPSAVALMAAVAVILAAYRGLLFFVTFSST